METNTMETTTMATTPMPAMTQIKASAGSGKTYTLTQQFLAHLSLFGGKTARGRACSLDGPESDWRSVMAITFTNAAASEMQERVLTFLKERALGLGGNRDLKLSQKEALIWLERIMHDRASLNISTIDSLLNLIVRMSALSENLPPDFTPVFTTGEILDPIWQELSNEAWLGNAQLKELISEICRRTAASSPKKSFLAGETITSTLAMLTGLLLTEKLGELVDPDLLQTPDGKGLLPKLKKGVWELALTVTQADGQVPPGESAPVVMDKTFVKGINKCVSFFEEQLGTNDPKSVAPAQMARISVRDLENCLKSESFKKNAPKTVKKSAPASAQLRTAYRELVESVAELRALDRLYVQSHINQPFLELANIVHERYTANLQRDSLLPNDRIPVMVERILSSDHGVAEALCRMGTRITHFLVDEFQDTSRDHWRALKPLVAEALSTGGSFSWVGDVKQAIYGFRGGDSELFEDIAHDVELVRMLDDGEAERRTLDCNWRSRAEIIDFNNALFSPLEDVDVCTDVLEPDLKKRRDFLVPVSKVPGIAHADTTPDTPLLNHVAARMAEAYRGGAQRHAPKTTRGGRVHLLVFAKSQDEAGNEDNENDLSESGQSDNQSLDEGRDVQLEAATAIARHEHHKGHPWSDMLALVRTNSQAMKLARHLSAGGIPVITENSLLLDEHPLIAQTLALLAFLRAPEDDIAFWTLITGSILARTSMEDFPLARKDLDKELALLSRSRKKINADDHVEPLARLWRERHPEFWAAVMAPLMDASGSITPYDLVSEWYAREGVWQRFPEAEPFLSRFLEILHTARVKDIRSLGDFLDWWKAHGHEEKVPMPDGMDAVRIMTTHKAKGLQAPIVLVPWTSNGGSEKADLNIVEYVTKKHGTIRALCRDKKDIFPISAARTLKNRFETMNGFYVAFTRAEQGLYVFLADKPSGNGRHLQTLLEHAGAAVPTPEPWETFAKRLVVEESEASDGDGAATDAEPGAGDKDAHGPPATAACPAAFPAVLPAVLPFDELCAPGGRPDWPVGDWSMDGREGTALSPAWMPMEWMPKLRLHFDYQDESHPRDRAREEGVFVHACLEELARLPNRLRRDRQALDRAIERILEERRNRTFWLCDGTDFLDRARAKLAWYVDLDRRYGWLEHGYPEQSILTSGGRVLRTDLLVLHPDGPMVIEYKHGLVDDEYLRQYHAQVRAYLATLQATDPTSSPLGVVVCLKPGKLHPVTADGRSHDGQGWVVGDEAALTLLDETAFEKAMRALNRTINTACAQDADADAADAQGASGAFGREEHK